MNAAAEPLSPYDTHLPDQAAAAVGVSWTRAQIAIHRCDWGNARRYLLTARARAQDAGTRRTQAGLRAEAGHFWLRRGQIDKAIDQLERAHQDLALTKDAELLALVCAHLGEARLLGGEVDQAGRLVRDALRTAKQARSAFATQEALRVGLRHAHISADIGRLGELVSLAQDLLLQRPLDPWGAAMAAQTALGHLELGDRDAARRWLTHASKLAPEDPYHQQLVRLAQLAFQAGTHDLEPTATAQLAATCRQLGLDHLSRLAVGFTVRWTGKPENTHSSSLLLDAQRDGDRYTACWLSLTPGSKTGAVRNVRALGYVAMAAGVALPA
ncbi:MAG: hypothetical protein GXP62_14580 [Oligoflexia bacterium]|nr:hypothetical protein [Oligoflexia bacterium]